MIVKKYFDLSERASLSFPKRHILDSSKRKEFADDNFRFDEMTESSPEGQKTLWEKVKLLVTSNFSFSYSVFKRRTADS